MEERNRKHLAIGTILLFGIFLAAVGVVVGAPVVKLAGEPEDFRQWVDSFGIWSRLVFFGIVVFQVLVAFIPGEPIELAAGYIFGVLEGTLLTMAGFLVGSCIIFVLVRRYGIRLVKVFFTNDQIDQVSFLKNPRKTRALAFVLMTIPGTPKDFLSYFAGLTQLGLGDWLGIVAVSRIPSLITSTASGSAAGDENYILSALMLFVTLLVSVAGVGYYRQLCKAEKVTEQYEKKNPTA